MIFIPGVLISAVTFPGVIVHELAHQLFCRLMRVPVYEVKYFQLKNPSGYVVHERSPKPLANFLITIGPFLLGTLLGAMLLLPASVEMSEFGLMQTRVTASPMVLLSFVAYWLGLSILMHAFPSTGDAKVLVETVVKNKQVNLLVRILVAPVVGLMYVGALGSMVWLDLGYALLIAALMPQLIALFL